MGALTRKLKDGFNRAGAVLHDLYGPPDVDPNARLPRALAYPMTFALFTMATSPLAVDAWMLLALPVLMPIMKPLGVPFQVAINTVTSDIEGGFRKVFNSPAQRPLPKREQQKPGRGFHIRF